MSTQEYYNECNIKRPIVTTEIMGGLGNQLFELASAYSYAKKNNGILNIKYKTSNGNRPLYFDSFLKKFRQYLVHSLPENMEHWQEQYSTKFYDLGPLLPQGKFLHGHLQSSKYFGDTETKNEIKSLIEPEPELLNQILAKYNYLIQNKSRVVVVHSRQTDYLPVAHIHGPLNGDYYKQAINLILKKVENPIFILCGDDNTYWNRISNDISEVYKYNWQVLENESDINTLILLQQFENFIMSNSTFIWWAVWLSKYKNVVVPSKWFGPYGPAEYEDIYEESWIRI